MVRGDEPKEEGWEAVRKEAEEDGAVTAAVAADGLAAMGQVSIDISI